jgi:endogenous inhibitor of DNA gyrase (YacG/DUF329 family)
MASVMRCPSCGAEVPLEASVRPASFPFCSTRCRTIDLGNWADGSYVVPGRSLAVDLDDDAVDDLERLRQAAADRERLT